MNRMRQAAGLAALCAVLMTGCGDSSSAHGAADAGTGISRTAVQHSETSVTLPDASTVPDGAGTESRKTGDPVGTTNPNGPDLPGSSETAADSGDSQPGLIERAESALESAGEAATGLLTDLTRTVGENR